MRMAIESEMVVARAKRGRVVENEYEKANCRPTRPDTASLEARRKRNAKMPKGRFQNRSCTFFKRPISYLKRKHFRRKIAKLRPTSFLKRKHFRRKLLKSRPTSYLERGHFRRKLVTSRPTSYLKKKHFRRKFVKSRPTSYSKGEQFDEHCLN